MRRRDSSKVGIPASLKPLLGYLCLEPASTCHRERVVEVLWPKKLVSRLTEAAPEQLSVDAAADALARGFGAT